MTPRTCTLPSCRAPFTPKAQNQAFCCQDHREEFKFGRQFKPRAPVLNPALRVVEREPEPPRLFHHVFPVGTCLACGSPDCWLYHEDDPADVRCYDCTKRKVAAEDTTRPLPVVKPIPKRERCPKDHEPDWFVDRENHRRCRECHRERARRYTDKRRRESAA